ncbi:MAG: dual specificity protein kinase kns1 [Trizodia sp. TS-e1964]|nr:MAG: dual specificity protein kinase kns1 [Trizodia sp. TS-e1964]
MSTPSTASAAIPPPHSHYGYIHRPGFSAVGAGYHANTILNNNPSSTNRMSSNTFPFPAQTPANPSRKHLAVTNNTPANTTASAVSTSANSTTALTSLPRLPPLLSSTTAMPSGTTEDLLAVTKVVNEGKKRQPDWNAFYRNGVPAEIIVIDDTPPPPRVNHTTRTVATTGHKHADKRRKVNGANADLGKGHRQEYAYSATQTPLDDASTISTDRTTSALHTTAATSLGSHYSQTDMANGGYIPYAQDVNVGQKRKRVTRAAVADEAKRREIEAQGDAYSSYVPPPRPPIKAKEVYVSLIHDREFHKNQKVDDEDGHYIVDEGADLTDRYEIKRLLGQGTFGKVVEAYDKRKKTHCAIKIIRSVQKYRDASRIELRVLSTLASNDKENRNKCIHLRDCFDFRNHICIVTDLLDKSVFDFLKGNQFVPFPSSQIQSFARQLFTSVAFLHDLNLVHTDLKPENILLVDSNYQTFTYNRPIPSSSSTVNRTARHRRVLLDTEIRLIDFGSATFDDEYHSSVVSTRHYRAPEIILGLGWSFPCDIWSIGCILVEFFTGDALFQTHDNLEHLAMMESVCNGKIDPKLIRQTNHAGRHGGTNPAAKYFVKNRLDYPNSETAKTSKRYVKCMKKLTEIIPPTGAFNRQFLDLLRKIFLYDPKQRITAKQALQHPWFKESIPDDGTEAAKIRVQRQLEKRPISGYHIIRNE